LAKGIARDRYGISARLCVKGVKIEQRFEPDTPLEQIQKWLRDKRVELEEDGAAIKEQRADRRGMLRSMAAFVRAKKRGRACEQADRSHLKAWIPKIGNKRRHQVKPHDIECALGDWREEGVAVRTQRHRLRVLREMYEYLDPNVTHPLTDVKWPKIEKTLPVVVGDDVIARVWDSLQKGLRNAKGHGSDPRKARAWFAVRITTGQRPKQIAFAEPGDLHDLDGKNPTWRVKAVKGGTGVSFPLSERGVLAWKLFIDADAWGGYDSSSFGKLLRRHGWPKTAERRLSPYALRHTFAVKGLRQGLDLGRLQGLLGHTSPITTRIYAPYEGETARDIVNRIDLPMDMTPKPRLVKRRPS
jgi:site-specific recombinase XerD